MKKISYLPILLIAVFILGFPKSHALTTEERDAAKAQKEATRTSKIAENCTTISSKVAQRKQGIEKSILSIDNSVKKIEATVNKKITELNQKGIDTQKLSTNLNEFKNKANTLKTSKLASLNTLNSLDQSTCQSNKKTFSEGIKANNALIKEQNNLQKELKTYVRTNVVAVIKSLGKTNE